MNDKNGNAGLWAVLGPGLLVAATGIGAGDLATASFTGSILGTAVLWAAVVGAFLKYVVTEGLARWQLATGDTLLEGLVLRMLAKRPEDRFANTTVLLKDLRRVGKYQGIES